MDQSSPTWTKFGALDPLAHECIQEFRFEGTAVIQTTLNNITGDGAEWASGSSGTAGFIQFMGENGRSVFGWAGSTGSPATNLPHTRAMQNMFVSKMSLRIERNDLISGFELWIYEDETRAIKRVFSIDALEEGDFTTNQFIRLRQGHDYGLNFIMDDSTTPAAGKKIRLMLTSTINMGAGFEDIS